jgi:hypothetical protein
VILIRLPNSVGASPGNRALSGHCHGANRYCCSRSAARGSRSWSTYAWTRSILITRRSPSAVSRKAPRARIRCAAASCAHCAGSSVSRTPNRRSCSRRSAAPPSPQWAFARLVERAGEAAQLGFKAHPHMPASSRLTRTCLRVRSCRQRARHPRPSGLPRTQEHPAHGRYNKPDA